MIFISGVHGVGKSYFCNIAKDKLGISAYSASQLISKEKNELFAANKLIADIEDNQVHLLSAIAKLRATGKEFILDGHFCLLDSEDKITRISFDTFKELNPDAIVLLTEDAAVIKQRRLERDNVQINAEDIEDFQEEERIYAEYVSSKLGVPLKISSGSDDIDSVIRFIDSRRK